MRQFIFISLLFLSCLSHSQTNDIAWEIRADGMAPFTNNLTFGIERKFKNFGIQLDYGFPLQLFKYDGNIIADVPEDEKYDEGRFFKLSYKNYTLLNWTDKYLQFQFMHSSYGNSEDWFKSYGFFVGIGERKNHDWIILDYYISLGLGHSPYQTRDYHFGFVALSANNPMISLGVALSFPIRKRF